mmetsp:Transcript_18444/g.38205  ORF Transcript_18444/g.38205 Transcript_18444/m.38205 type:complete len:258 (+) Transcript_18444:90-863(+)
MKQPSDGTSIILFVHHLTLMFLHRLFYCTAFHPTLPPIPTTQSSRRHHLHVRNPSNNKPHNLADAAKRIPKNDVFQIAPLSGVGLTSILPQQQKSVTTSFSEQTLQSDDYGSAEATMTTFVGTKRGELMQVSIHPSDPIEASVIPIKYFNEEIDLKPYPIFSMASLPYHHRHSESTVRSDCKQLILTGGADRFISVWEEESPCTKDESATSSRWKIKERLGPHTGNWSRAMRGFGARCNPLWNRILHLTRFSRRKNV